MKFLPSNHCLRLLLVAGLFGWIIVPGHAGAEEMRGRVAHVPDGDSLIFMQGNRRLQVRLIGIDAPEKGQAGANEARSALSKLVLKKNVRLVSTGRDQYGRTLAGVFVGELAVQNELLRRGLVWVYPTYRRNQKLMKLERTARSAKRGIWKSKDPVPPWVWKKRKREGSRANHDHDHNHEHDSDCAKDHARANSASKPAATTESKPTKPKVPMASGGCPIN